VQSYAAGGSHFLTTSDNAGLGRSSISRPAWPMKMKPAIRSPGAQKALRTRSE
jgi:hypothetical protein